MPPTRHHLAVVAAGLALLAGGCATPAAAPAAGPAAGPMTEPVVAVSDGTADVGRAEQPREVRVVIPVVEAATTWVPRTVTTATGHDPAADPAPDPVPDPAPEPEPAPAPPPTPVTPPPPDLVVGEDGCVTDRTTGLVVACYDEAAGPDEE